VRGLFCSKSRIWIFFVLCCPVVLPGASTAKDEKILGLPKIETLYTDPEEALQHGRPVRIEREARYLKQWRLWLLAEHNHYYEGSDTTISLRRPNGEVSVTYPPMSGPAIVSESQKRILDCGISAHTMVEFAVVYDDAGREIRRIPKVLYTRDCGKTHDERLFWLHYSSVEDGAAVNVIRFIDRDGYSVHEAKRARAGTVSFKHKSRSYSIAFPTPEYPN